MRVFTEGALTFVFTDEFQVKKFDETVFYRKHFVKTEKPLRGDGTRGTKAVDFIIFEPRQSQLWLLEVKDYNFPNARIGLNELVDEIVKKILDSLACLLAMRANALAEEQLFAAQAIQKNHLRIVLHLEQPTKTSKEFPFAIDPSDLKDRLKTRLRSIDPQPIISSIAASRTVPWTVK